MHALSFGVKRAHLCTVEVLKKIAKEFDLTPARFDVMFVLRSLEGECEQSQLWARLGVSRQTMSKMLKGMEEKGLVWREGDPDDTRRRIVTMTAYGLERFVAAAKEVFRTDRLRKRFDAMHDEGRAFVEKAANVVKHVARALRDTARHCYSIHEPDADTIKQADRLNERVHRYVKRIEALRPKDQELEFYDPEELTEDEMKLLESTTWDPHRLQAKLMTIQMYVLHAGPAASLRELKSLIMQMG